MKLPVAMIAVLLLAACASSPPLAPTTPRITFDGDYIDVRNSPPAAKIYPLHKESPPIPLALRKAGIDVAAVIAFMVEKDGTTSHAQIVSTTNDEFAEIARQSVLGWRYAPPKKDGKPVRMVLEEPFNLSFGAKR